MIEAVDLFRALADETRLRCLALLVSEGELCVCELTHALGEIQPKVSRHLASLRASGVVRDRKAGQWVHYRLAEDLPPWALTVLRAAAEAPGRGDDGSRLAAMAGRPARCA